MKFRSARDRVLTLMTAYSGRLAAESAEFLRCADSSAVDT